MSITATSSTTVGAGSTADVIAVAAGVFAFGAVFAVALAAHRPAVRRPTRPASSAVHGRTGHGRIVVGILTSIVAIVVAGPVGAAVVGLVILTGRGWRRLSTVNRRRLAVEVCMPDAVELFVLCVHAGFSPTQAIAELAASAPAPVRQAFASVELQLHRGRTLADALTELPRHAGPPGRELAAAVATADRDGLALAPVLDRLAAAARADRRRAGDAAARRLPVRLSFPLVACTLPSFVLLAIAPAVLGALSTLRGRAP